MGAGGGAHHPGVAGKPFAQEVFEFPTVMSSNAKPGIASIASIASISRRNLRRFVSRAALPAKTSAEMDH